MTPYLYLDVARGDYGSRGGHYNIHNSSGWLEAFLTEAAKIRSDEERWHLRDQVSYAAASRCLGGCAVNCLLIAMGLPEAAS
jgi:hypothetical protein